MQNKIYKNLKIVFPSLTDTQIKKFIEELFGFIIGFYPMFSLNEIQKEALKKAKTGYYPPDFEKILKEQIICILRNILYHSGEKISSIPYRII